MTDGPVIRSAWLRRRATHNDSQKGFVLAEMLIAIALTAVVATLATQLLVRTLRTGRDLSVNERQELAIDRAIERLRHDVESAKDAAANNNGLALDNVRWTVEPGALVRSEGPRVDRFEPLGGTPALAVAGDLVTLHLSDQEWAFSSLIDRGGSQ